MTHEPTTAELIAFLENESCFQSINGWSEKGQTLFAAYERLKAAEATLKAVAELESKWREFSTSKLHPIESEITQEYADELKAVLKKFLR